MSSIMSTFNQATAIEKIIISEGGEKYTDDPTDAGGKTKWGVTEKESLRHKDLWAQYNYNGVVRDMPKGLAVAIYKRGFWDTIRLDDIFELSTPLTYMLFSIGINSGPGKAGEHLQRALNLYNQNATLYPDIVVDGSVGPKTVATLEACLTKRGIDGLRAIVMTVFSFQMNYYTVIAEHDHTQEKYSLGWANRMIEIIKECSDDIL